MKGGVRGGGRGGIGRRREGGRERERERRKSDLRLSGTSGPVSIYDWHKHGFVTHEVNAEVACAPY